MKMHKFSLVSLAIATTLAISPAVSVGQATYSFNFSSSIIKITGGEITIAGSPVAGTNGGYDILGISGTYSDTATNIYSGSTPGSGDFSGSMSLYNPGTYGTDSSPIYSPTYTAAGGGTYEFQFDNLFYPAGNAPDAPGSDFDYQGVVFYVTIPGGGSAVNLYGVYSGGSTAYAFAEGVFGVTGPSTGTIPLPPTPEPKGNITPTPAAGLSVPESGAQSMLMLCVFGLAGAFYFKSRQSGLSRDA